MRKNGKLLFLSELLPFFKKSHFFCFGTGGSVANIKNLEKVSDKNIMAATYGPYYLQKEYGVMPNFWPVSYGPVIDYVLKLEKKENFRMDLSSTFVLIPTLESNTKINVHSPSIGRLLKSHPEATIVLYHRMEASVMPDNIPEFFLSPGVEPLLAFNDHTLHNLFLPILAYLDVENIYFSGIDLISQTGHFWNRDLVYQSMQGVPLTFPDFSLLDQGYDIVKKKSRINAYRLEPNETRLKKFYPLIDFDESLENSGPRVTPFEILKILNPIIFHDC